MNDVLPCLEKGCCQTTLTVDEAWIDIKEQALTGLTERLCAILSSKNEAAHRPLNQLVHEISQIRAVLMEARLDVAIHMHNRRMDKIFGRLDDHSRLFSWMDDNVNSILRSTFKELPYPALAHFLPTPLLIV